MSMGAEQFDEFIKTEATRRQAFVRARQITAD